MLGRLLYVFWPFCLEFEAFALKVAKDHFFESDLDVVERRIREGDQRGSNEALLAAAERGKQHLAMVLAELAVRGYDPEEIQVFLSAQWRKPFSALPGVHPVNTASFQALLEDIEKNRPAAAKEIIIAMAKEGGPHRLANSLKALQLLGYNPKELQTWIQGTSAVILARGPTRVAASMWNIHLLLEALQRADKSGVKNVLAQVVKNGGTKEMTWLLGSFAAMGYSYTALLQWLQSAGTAKAPDLQIERTEAQQAQRVQQAQKVQEPEKTQHVQHVQQAQQAPEPEEEEEDLDFKVLIGGIKTGNRPQVKESFARIWNKGGLETAFSRLQAMGYDLDAIKEWYEFEGFEREVHAPFTSMVAVNETVSVHMNGSIMLTKAFVESDMEMAKTALKGMLQRDALAQLTHLHALGFNVASMKRWLTAHERASSHASTNGDSPLSVSDGSFQEILTGLQHSNKTQVIKQLAFNFRRGGKRRLEDLFSRLEMAGYSAQTVQAWLGDTSPAAPSRASIRN